MSMGQAAETVAIALLFVGMFQIQRLIKGYYFGFGELVYGVRASIEPLAFLLKALMIAFFAVLCFSVTHAEAVTIAGVTLGSFLIVWPAVLYPGIEGTSSQRWYLYASFLVFAGGSYALATAGVWAYAEAAPVTAGIPSSGPGVWDVLCALGLWVGGDLLLGFLKKPIHVRPKRIEAGGVYSVVPADEGHALTHSEELWGEIDRDQQRLFHARPVLGAPKWHVANVVELDRDLYAVCLEDGHVDHHALVRRSSRGRLETVCEEAKEDPAGQNP